MSALLPTYNRAPISFAYGEGAWLVTAAGERYLDFAGGVAVNVLGHAHPALVAAVREQAGKLWHTSNLYRVDGQERLAQRLCEATFADRVFFCNSGAEALECAIKMARKYHSAAGQPERWRILTFEGAFHGRTLATIAASRNPKHIEGFGPMPDGFDQVPLGNLDAVKSAFTEQTAAILIEPIQGEGGIRMPPSGFLAALRQLADEHGVLLVLDEVQSGMGRTGRLFAHEWRGIVPDIMAVAKGLGGGFPIGACLASEAAAAGMTAGTHGSTFGGNPLAMAVGNAVMDIVAQPDFLNQVGRTGLALKQRLAGLVDMHPGIFRALRGEGLMLGLECVVPAGEMIAALMTENMLAVPAGENVIRLLPPLIIGEIEIDAALTRLEAAALAVRGAKH